MSPKSPALAGWFFTTKPPRKLVLITGICIQLYEVVSALKSEFLQLYLWSCDCSLSYPWQHKFCKRRNQGCSCLYFGAIKIKLCYISSQFLLRCPPCLRFPARSQCSASVAILGSPSSAFVAHGLIACPPRISTYGNNDFHVLAVALCWTDPPSLAAPTT